MIVSLMSAKGSPGVTASALALAACWPRPAVLLEADVSGSDGAFRCAAASGGSVTASPNLLGLVTATKGDSTATVEQWSQPLACGVSLVAGITAPVQARALVGSWDRVLQASVRSELDVIVDLGRVARDQATVALVHGADVVVPVLTPSVESLIRTRQQLQDMSEHHLPAIHPLLVGRSRTAAADRDDVDSLLADSGLFARPASHLPLDHPGLLALEAGARPTGRGRRSHLLRAAAAVGADVVGAHSEVII